jgi:hypothetical protein
VFAAEERMPNEHRRQWEWYRGRFVSGRQQLSFPAHFSSAENVSFFIFRQTNYILEVSSDETGILYTRLSGTELGRNLRYG